jgi:aspartyl-tRNA(Asn)/glutamyl-tRNA(Gln) amidotransferase subunit A
MDTWREDASSLADAVRVGRVRAADALEASLDAIARSKLNAVVFLDAEGARKTAAEIDRRVAAGEDPGLLAGVPVLSKDLEDAAGMPTTHGSVVFKDNVPGHDSTHTARIRAAGAIIVGKSAAPEFGLVAYTASKLHGVTRNPWSLERTPAGSSGGSAAAVAGGLVPIATATDGGGSIRLPASYCGLIGMKGSYGRIPRGPRAELGPITSVLGCEARSVRDAARWYDVAAGYDPRDAFSLPRVEGWERGLGTHTLRGLRVAFSVDLNNSVVQPDVARVVTEAADALIASTGMRRVEVDVRLPANGIAWASAGLPGLVADLRDKWPECRDDLTFEIRYGMDSSDRYRARHAAAVDRFRMEMTEAMADLFEQIDILLCPTSPTEPFAAEGPMPRYMGETKLNPYNGGALTIPANISGYPAVSMPAGLSPSGLPIGLQAYARRHEDAILLDLALAMERTRPWPLLAPGAPV